MGSLVRGKYRIEAFISKGSMAAVYEASHRNGTKVALKVLHAVYSKDESLRTRFLREGYLANSVDHPGTVKIVDDDITEDGCVFLVMELLKGDTLEQWRVKSGGRAPLEEALAVADQLLAVLEAAHKKGIVHRDLKPENVFVTEEGTLKVLDWGVANVWDGQKSSEMTGTGMVLGTPAFMPPEQALGKRNEVDAQSDLWAIGATLFMLLSGESVHPGGDAVAKLVATARKPARSLAVVAPELPAAVVAAVDRSLAFKKVDRFANATVMRQAFAAAIPKVRHYGDSQDDEPTLFGRHMPSDGEPNTERHLQTANAHHEEHGPITLDRPTERGRQQKKAEKDSVPPPTEIPMTRAPHTSPMPLAGISMPTPGSGFEPPSSTARMPRTIPPHPFTQTAALPVMRGPMSSNPGGVQSVVPAHHPMSTPLSSAQPIPSMHGAAPAARPPYHSDMRVEMRSDMRSDNIAPPEIAPAELAGMPLPNDLANTSGAHSPSGRGKGGLVIALVAVVVLVAGAGLVIQKRRAAGIEPVAAVPSALPSAYTPTPTGGELTFDPVNPGATNGGASAVPGGSNAEAVQPPTSGAADAAPAVSVASLEPRPRPRPRPVAPAASSAPTDENPTPPTTATPPSSAGTDPTPTPIPIPTPSATRAKTAEPAKSAEPPTTMPEKIPALLPDDPN